MEESVNSIEERLEEVDRRIAAACERAGRDPADVSLLAVAKTFGPDAVTEAAAAGITVIGENKVQEAAAKIPLCPGHLKWHMIGHLQRNKVCPAVELFECIHSVDSLRLLEAIDRAGREAGRTVPAMLEINVSGEGSKYGLKPEETPTVLKAAEGLTSIEGRGLMSMPPFAPEPESARPYFRRLRELRDEWRSQSGVPLEDLSMGMSNDFEVAVEEGATWVRLGSVLFGTRTGRAWRRQDAPDSGGDDL